jgi:heme exporter protein CcmD
MMEFISMGGYARYVWSAFGISFAILVVILWLTRRNFVLTKQTLLRQLRSTEGMQK